MHREDRTIRTERFSPKNNTTFSVCNWEVIVVISLASDHAGYEMRERIAAHLIAQGYSCVIHGAVNAETAASYVAAGKAAAEDVATGIADRGIVICGTGIGISIVCNKRRKIRCALCTNEFMASMARQHNDANILALGARVMGIGLALSVVDSFMRETFETGGRHQVRVNEISEYEKPQNEAHVT